MSNPLFGFIVCLCLQSGGASQSPASDFRLPPGFAIERFADHEFADDITCLTIDAQERITVAGRGYIKLIRDENSDGKADRATLFSNTPADGAQGLLWEGQTLYAVGDGGLRKFMDRNGDGQSDGPSELLVRFRTGGEHDAHALRRGPDRWLYLLCGNTANASKSLVKGKSSPIQDPVAGCVVRFSPDWTLSEIVADGFRNAYSMDFNADGELFTFDSDNERCLGLPWYEPTRFYHVVPGGHYGWRSPQRGETWRYPPHFADVLPPVCILGRGSPTAVLWYQHTQYPQSYQGSFFLADWTFGRIFHVRLERDGGSYRAHSEIFLEAKGDSGFAPTAMSVHPRTGELYVTSGGRGTRGAIYRIRYQGKPVDQRPSKTGLAALPLEWSEETHAQALLLVAHADPLQRCRAIAFITRHLDRFTNQQIAELLADDLSQQDRYVGWAVTRLWEQVLLEKRHTTNMPAKDVLSQLRQFHGNQRVRILKPEELQQIGGILSEQDTTSELKMFAVRLLQRHLWQQDNGSPKKGAFEGYSTPTGQGNLPREVLHALRSHFPSGNRQLDQELGRLFSLLQEDSPGVLDAMVKQITKDSDPRDDFHTLIVLSQLRGERTRQQTAAVAEALLGLPGKMEAGELIRDRHWPIRLQEVVLVLYDRDPKLPQAVVQHPVFGHPEHTLYVVGDRISRRTTAQFFWRRIVTDETFSLTPEVIDLIAEIADDKIKSRMRREWENWSLRGAILKLLAKQPTIADWPLFVESLSSPNLAQVVLSTKALAELQKQPTLAEIRLALRALQRQPVGPEGKTPRQALARLLRSWTQVETDHQDFAWWKAWYTSRHPRTADELDQLDGIDMNQWVQRLAKLNWSEGNRARGAVVYRKTGCLQCHSGSRALGPDLVGVTRRFSRDDLFTAILQPNRDVPARYRTRIIQTKEGKILVGSIVYEAVDGVLLQTDATTTVRIAGNSIESMRPSALSLMPAGLLDRCSDADLVDLYAYLKSLDGSKMSN